MRLSQFVLFALVITFISVIACKDNKGDAATETPATTAPEGAMAQDPSATSTAASGSTEGHYKCTKAGCTGTGDAQGKCPICGSDLAHNQAFHSQATGAQSTPGSTPANAVQVNPAEGTTATPPPPAAQNEKGVYHYTCPKGDPGGAATAGNCSKCGEALTHNPAYHTK